MLSFFSPFIICLIWLFFVIVVSLLFLFRIKFMIIIHKYTQLLFIFNNKMYVKRCHTKYIPQIEKIYFISELIETFEFCVELSFFRFKCCCAASNSYAEPNQTQQKKTIIICVCVCLFVCCSLLALIYALNGCCQFSCNNNIIIKCATPNYYLKSIFGYDARVHQMKNQMILSIEVTNQRFFACYCCCVCVMILFFGFKLFMWCTICDRMFDFQQFYIPFQMI